MIATTTVVVLSETMPKHSRTSDQRRKCGQFLGTVVVVNFFKIKYLNWDTSYKLEIVYKYDRNYREISIKKFELYYRSSLF